MDVIPKIIKVHKPCTRYGIEMKTKLIIKKNVPREFK